MLIGEYAVLDGAPAAVAAIGCYAKASWYPGSESARSPFLAAAKRCVEAQLKEHGRTLPPGQPGVSSHAFFRDRRKLGLGSSAAVTVAAVGMMFEKAGLLIREHRPWIQRLALQAHQEAQGVQGSGADILASTWGHIHILNGEGISAPLPAHLRLVATGSSMSTSDVLRTFYAMRNQAKDAMKTLAQAAQDFLVAWKKKEQKNLFDAVESSIEGYRSLGSLLEHNLITPDQEIILQAARIAGGTAKPSGAGGGDISVVFLPNVQAESIFQSHLPAHLWVLPYAVLNVPGVRFVGAG